MNFFLTRKNYKKAFTLVELMIAVVIIGLLVMVAVPQFQKYVIKVAKSEAILMMRKATEAQTMFVAQQPFIHHVFKDRVCPVGRRFSAITGFCSQDANCTGYNAVRINHPKGTKKFICSLQAKKFFLETDCRLSTHSIFGNLHEIYGTVIGDYSSNPDTYHVVRQFEQPSKFILYAGIDSNVASEYGVDQVETLTIRAVADMDNDNPSTAWYGFSHLLNHASSPMASDNLWVLQRSMYYKDGEVILNPGFFELNPGE